MRVGWVHAAETFVHDSNLGMKGLNLLVRIASVIRGVTESVDLVAEAGFGVLVVLDMLDGYHCISRDLSQTQLNLTFCQNLPFRCLGTSTGRHRPVELFKQVLHLTSALALGKFVADSQFWSTAVVAAT